MTRPERIIIKTTGEIFKKLKKFSQNMTFLLLFWIKVLVNSSNQWIINQKGHIYNKDTKWNRNNTIFFEKIFFDFFSNFLRLISGQNFRKIEILRILTNCWYIMMPFGLKMTNYYLSCHNSSIWRKYDRFTSKF